jgi:hypothetical protein
MAFVNERKPPGHRRAIDYERDIILTAVSRINQDGLNSFFLDWHGRRIYFQGREIGTNRFRDKNGEPRFNLKWVISGIYIPEGFSENKENVFKVICEALDAYGTYFDRDHVDNVTVTHTKYAYDFEMPDLSGRNSWDELEDML